MRTDQLSISLWKPVYESLRHESRQQGLLVSELSRLFLQDYAREFEFALSSQNDIARLPSILGAEAFFPNFLRAPKFRYNVMLEPNVRETYHIANNYFGVPASHIGRLVITRGLLSELL